MFISTSLTHVLSQASRAMGWSQKVNSRGRCVQLCGADCVLPAASQHSRRRIVGLHYQAGRLEVGFVRFIDASTSYMKSQTMLHPTWRGGRGLRDEVFYCVEYISMSETTLLVVDRFASRCSRSPTSRSAFIRE